jgi:hypothetical protein
MNSGSLRIVIALYSIMPVSTMLSGPFLSKEKDKADKEQVDENGPAPEHITLEDFISGSSLSTAHTSSSPAHHGVESPYSPRTGSVRTTPYSPRIAEMLARDAALLLLDEQIAAERRAIEARRAQAGTPPQIHQQAPLMDVQAPRAYPYAVAMLGHQLQQQVASQ